MKIKFSNGFFLQWRKWETFTQTHIMKKIGLIESLEMAVQENEAITFFYEFFLNKSQSKPRLIPF